MNQSSLQRRSCLRGLLTLGIIVFAANLARGQTDNLQTPGIDFLPRSESAGRHDMLLLLPEGPIHLRLNITDGGKSLAERRDAYRKELVAALDADHNGKLDRDEPAHHPLFVRGRRFEGNAFLNSLRSRRPYTQREIELAIDRAAGQLVSYRQNDALADQDLAVFRVLDADDSGLIERGEMRSAGARIAKLDRDFDQCVTFDEFLSDAEPLESDLFVFSFVEPDSGPGRSELLRDANEPLIAARLIRRYDRDGDAHLTAQELSWKVSRVGDLDRNADGKLNVKELSGIASSRPEVWLEIDLSKDSSQAMSPVGVQSPQVNVARSDLVRLRLDEMFLGIAYRNRDPIGEAKRSAEAAFNAIDVDANGYLDREEISEHQRFERYLFDAMDQDDDDRLFANEMTRYVEQYTRPASTSCQITLMNHGNGFFQLLDLNSDGRVSLREMRNCESSLREVAVDGSLINPSTLNKSYRIEIQRGGRSLFGRMDRPTLDSPTAMRKPLSGPIWFQRMDRNSDGDLTWDEFLGPRNVFVGLDADGDNLIDESEARKASQQEAS